MSIIELFPGQVVVDHGVELILGVDVCPALGEKHALYVGRQQLGIEH